MNKLVTMSTEPLRIDYDSHRPNANRFMSTVIEQLSNLLDKNGVTLGTPIESRVKTILSIEDKLIRKNKSISSVTELDDLVGIRIIVLFKSDIQKTCDLVKQHFHVVDEEDVAKRLQHDQFGYQSTHYSVKLPVDWLALPTLYGLAPYKAELQIRTLSQHIWAVASHKLQYKHENNVPAPLRRSINRVSALLETVDLEFERVLKEREEYVSNINENSTFNVDVIEVICDQLLPKQNKDYGQENYSEIFSELILNSIDTAEKLTKLINDFLPSQLLEDQERVEQELQYPTEMNNHERLNIGVFYTHVGLVRGCLHKLVGESHKYVNFSGY